MNIDRCAIKNLLPPWMTALTVLLFTMRVFAGQGDDRDAPGSAASSNGIAGIVSGGTTASYLPSEQVALLETILERYESKTVSEEIETERKEFFWVKGHFRHPYLTTFLYLPDGDGLFRVRYALAKCLVVLADASELYPKTVTFFQIHGDDWEKLDSFWSRNDNCFGDMDLMEYMGKKPLSEDTMQRLGIADEPDSLIVIHGQYAKPLTTFDTATVRGILNSMPVQETERNIFLPNLCTINYLTRRESGCLVAEFRYDQNFNTFLFVEHITKSTQRFINGFSTKDWKDLRKVLVLTE